MVSVIRAPQRKAQEDNFETTNNTSKAKNKLKGNLRDTGCLRFVSLIFNLFVWMEVEGTVTPEISTRIPTVPRLMNSFAEKGELTCYIS